MLSYRFTATGKLQFFWPSVDTSSGERTCTLLVPSNVAVDAVQILANAVVVQCVRVAAKSYGWFIEGLKQTFNFLERSPECHLPPQDWDEFFDHFFESHLHSSKKRALKSTLIYWQSVESLFKQSRSEGLLPLNVILPSGGAMSGVLDGIDTPLGHEPSMVGIPTTAAELLPKIYLCNDSLHLEADQYLLKLKTRMELASTTVVSACTRYWDTMLKCHEKGRELIDEIPVDEVQRIINGGDFFVDGVHIAHPDNPKGLNWFLAVARHYAVNDLQLNTVTIDALRDRAFFRRLFSIDGVRKKLVAKMVEAAGDYAIRKKTKNETLNRLLGFLCPRDCGAACSILMSENPKFTAEAIGNSRLYTRGGKPYIRTEADLERIIFSVDKPRAGKRKVSGLPPLSAKIVMDVMACTKELRSRLIASGHPGWRKMFIISTRNKIGTSGEIPQSLHTGSGVSLFKVLIDELATGGIHKDGFTLKKIRATEGIIRFLETGNLRAVADLLGNSVAVVKSNYIPDFLRLKWATRGLRMMQQKLIIVATDGTPWEDEATDFTSPETRVIFIQKMLRDAVNGDAFSEIIRQRFKGHLRSGDELIKAIEDRELLIILSPESLAALYAHEASILNKGATEQTSEQPNTHSPTLPSLSNCDDGSKYANIPAEAIPALARLIRASATISKADLQLSEKIIIDKLSGDVQSQLAATHIEAMALLDQHKDKATFAYSIRAQLGGDDAEV
jgi:hypothetical protein